jgi:hypothetical protein
LLEREAKVVLRPSWQAIFGRLCNSCYSLLGRQGNCIISRSIGSIHQPRLFNLNFSIGSALQGLRFVLSPFLSLFRAQDLRTLS